MSSLAGFLPRIRRIEADEMIDVKALAAKNATKQQPTRTPTAKFRFTKQTAQPQHRSCELERTKAEKRLSQSETALARKPLNRCTSDEGPIAAKSQHSADSKTDMHTTLPVDTPTGQNRNNAATPGNLVNHVSPLSSTVPEDALPIMSPVSLDMPELGPSFGIDEAIFENDPRKDALQMSQISNSISSTPDIQGPASSLYSPVSSKSSISDFSTGNSPVQKAPPLIHTFSAVNPVAAGVFDESPVQLTKKAPSQNTKESTGATENTKKNTTENTRNSTKNNTRQQQPRKNKPAAEKNKPLPAVPMSVPTVKLPKEPPPRAPNHVVSLMSKYAASAPGWVDSDESPIDKYFRPRPVADEKTHSQAAFDLEFELERIIVEAKNEQTAQAPRSPRSPQKEEHVVAPLNVVTRKSTSASRGATAQAPPALAPPRSRQSPQPGDLPPYKLFPSNTTKHARLESNSSAESDASAPSSMKPSTDRSASTKTVSRRLRSSLRLPPNLRRQRPPTPQLVHEEAEPIEGGSLVSLEDDQAALAKSTDRYIDAQIAKALDVASEEDSDNLDAGADGSESDKKSNNINPQDEGEWSTIYPLKAVKKLGIPLMSSSHIPRLSSSDNEKALRLQLPKLNTIPPSTLVKPEIIPQPPPASVSKYPETPDDVGLHTRSFIVDSPSVQSPIEEENEMGEDDNDAMPHSDKIFIELNHVETVTDEMSPKTQEVPLTLTVETRPHHSRRQSKLYELDGNGSTPVVASPNPFENVNLPMPSQMPEKVVISLMENVNNLEELFNYALLNKQFYRVFKANELSLIKNALFQMSPPAWELREMSPPWTEELEGLKDPDAPVPEYTPESYLRHYGRDMIRLAKLKSLILARCGTIVRPETIAGLAGSDEMRADEIDEAFWRIWTFCRIFGCGKNRESDVNGQMDWLNGGDLAERNKSGATVLMAEPFFSINNVLFDPPAGFGKGNGDGLTHGQLYDMIEIWLCLGVLLQVIHGESKEARIAGVFEGMDISPGDILKEDAMLEEWTYYILTLGPSALVTLSSVCPTDSAQATFAKAKQMGVTRWEPPEYGATRQAFLREAITRTYEIRIAPQQNAQTRSASNGGSPVRQNHSAPIDNRSSYNTMHSAREPGRRPDISCFNSEDLSFGPYNGAPPYTANNTDNLPAPAPASGPPPRYSSHETFIDPVDRAIRMMVHDLGFSEHDAKWALKITDTGDMLDTDAAVRLLQKERKRRNKGKMTQLWRTGSNNNSGDESGPENLVDPLVNVPKHSGTVGWRWG